MPQPFYHEMTVLFTSTQDVSAEAKAPEFLAKLDRFLRRNLSAIVKDSVEIDGPVEVEPGDPHDLP